ncbi:MAG: TonB-dependent receptor [Bacteroidales bacterium]|nr:TonB-dependent receptor [Bacteroidales bacterium]
MKGRVTDEKGQPLELAVVSLNDMVWTTSDVNGEYVFANLKSGEYTFVVSLLGYDDLSGKVTVRGDTRKDFSLKDLSLELSGVTVTATREALGSKSTIGEEAIKHIQPKSVSDLLQLVPGNLSKNPNLNTLSQASVREIDENANNSLGTSVIVDGAPLSNDANLQAVASTRFGASSGMQSDGMGDQTTAGGGVDLRTISAGAVETIEVITGIPSAEYGNLTSGVLIVKTKAGKTPWEFKAQADPNSKLAYVGKGFALKKGGAFNFSADYSQSFADPRKRYLGYDRITGAFGFSKAWGKASLHLKGSLYSNVNTRRTDPQLEEQDITFTNINRGVRFSMYGNYNPNGKILTSLDYNVSSSLSFMDDIHRSKVWSPDGAYTDTKEDGIHTAVQKTKPYYAEYSLQGLPVNLFAQLVAGRYIGFRSSGFSKIRLGLEYTLDGNYGKGFIYDLENPPQSSGSQTLRQRSYKEIPSLNTLSAFLTDKIQWDAPGGLTAKAEAGIRVSNLFLDPSVGTGRKGYFVAEPRVNASLSILTPRNNSVFSDLSVNGGFGISNKMPTLLYLYPEPAYYDYVSLNRYTDDPSGRFAALTTVVIDNTSNESLLPAHSVKKEIGLSWKTKPVSGFATFFHENHSNEFGFDSQLVWGKYYRFAVEDGGTDIRLEGDQLSYLLDGERKIAGKELLTEYATWSKAANNTHSVKYGVEYGLDFGTIRPLRTSLQINGAWFHIARNYETPRTTYVSRTYDYAPVRPAGSGSIRDRFNTTFRFITHIPEVKMVVTTSVQVVWLDASRSVYNGPDGQPLVHPYSYQGREWLAVDPLGYYDLNGNYTVWDSATMNEDPALLTMIDRNFVYAFETDRIEPWAMLNIRLTKEIGRKAELSFTANNLTNSIKYHVNPLSYSKTQLYPSIYFGAEIKIKL